MNKDFLKECLKQLKEYNFCYVFTKSQVDEIIEKCSKEVKVVPNECGFTINVLKRGVKNDKN